MVCYYLSLIHIWLRGIEIAALLGLTGGDADKELAVLTAVTPETRDEARRLMGSGLCSCELIEGVANLYIVVEVTAGDENALVLSLIHICGLGPPGGRRRSDPAAPLPAWPSESGPDPRPAEMCIRDRYNSRQMKNNR